jgi:hypothetical protein
MPNLPDLSAQFIVKLALASRAVKALVIAGWLGFGNLVAQAQALDLSRLNALLNVALLVVVFVAAIPLVKSKRKDATIQDLNDSLEARDRRIIDLTNEAVEARQQTRQIEQGVAHLKEELAAAHTANEVLERFTAEHALTAVMTAMQTADQGHERRHMEVMLALKNVQTVLERS